MKSIPRVKTIFLIFLGFIFVLALIFSNNNCLYTSRDIQQDKSTYFDLSTSGLPAVPIWSYDTSSRNINVVISSNGQYIALACYDFNVYLFEKNSSTPLWSFNLGDTVQSVAITPDGKYIVAGTTRDTNTVYFFEKNSSTPLWNYTTTGSVMSLAFSSDGQYFAAGIGRGDPSVYLFEKNSSTPLWRYDIGSSVETIKSVGISSDGDYIVAGSYNGKLYFFGRNSSTPVWIYNTGKVVHHAAISSDGNYIVVGTNDISSLSNALYFFERGNSTPLWSNITRDPVWSLDISSDGQYIVVGTGYSGNKVLFFNRTSSTPLWISNLGQDVQSVAITPTGKYIVAGGYDEKVYLFDKNSSTPLWSYKTISNIETVAISSDGQFFVAGNGIITDGDSFVYLFHLAVTPYIKINSPLLNQSFRLDAPEFSTTIYNLSPLNKTWYTIDGGINNYTFSGSTGFINQTAWNNEEDGVINIKFYANDSLGHVGFKDVQILKDSVCPVITIHSPLEGRSFGDAAPSFNISIIEENMDFAWYTLEGVASNFSLSEFAGYIDQDAWISVPEGQVNMTFYAKDDAGNLGIERVFVIKILPPQIPGYNIIFLLSIISYVSIILVKKIKSNKGRISY